MFIHVALVIVLSLTPVHSGLCIWKPIEEQICESPDAFKGLVLDTEMISENGLETTAVFTIKVKDVYRSESGDLSGGETVKLVDKNQLLSIGIFMDKGEDYIVQGSLKNDNGSLEIASGFCDVFPVTILVDDDVKKLEDGINC